MALTTKETLRNLFIYQIFVRNYSLDGTLKAVENDLLRIKDLGVDVIYLLPIHPIGKKDRKGTYGSPYSIKDYYEVSPDLGTINDFKSLIKATHDNGMKIMMDIVFNHTSRDSKILAEHENWIYHNEKGEVANRVGDWWDICDIDFSQDGVYKELTNVLVYYAKMGVDGFRCDVASLVPLKFWEHSITEVRKINKDIIFLAEAVHGGFIKYLRDLGYEAHSESEIYQFFDMNYDYDIQPYFESFLKGDESIDNYLLMLKNQEYIYPKNYVKLHNLENHDYGRFANLVGGDYNKIINWYAFGFLEKGAFMMYNGGEFLATKQINLFEKDVFRRDTKDISDFIKKLAKLKKEKIFAYGVWNVDKLSANVIKVTWEYKNMLIISFFNLSGIKERVKTSLNGKFYSYLDEQEIFLDDEINLLLPVILISNN